MFSLTLLLHTNKPNIFQQAIQISFINISATHYTLLEFSKIPCSLTSIARISQRDFTTTNSSPQHMMKKNVENRKEKKKIHKDSNCT